MNKATAEVRAIDELELDIGPNLLGEIYLELGYINQAQLHNALDYQRRKGGRLGWILGSLGYMNRLQLYEGLAKHFDLTFMSDLQYLKNNIDQPLAKKVSQEEIVEHQVIPLNLNGDTLTVATSNPNCKTALDFLLLKFRPITVTEIVISDLDLMKLSEYLYGSALLKIATHGLIVRNSAQSASSTFSKGQLIFFALLIISLVGWFLFSKSTLFLITMFAVQFFYLGSLGFKSVISMIGLIGRLKDGSSIEACNLVESELPVYTILVPVYKEPKVIRNLIKALKRLDYPEDRLDIILLLEENDADTLAAAKAEKPPVSWRFLTLPDGIPKTKPKALNYGLQFSRGQYLTIFDAEDMPDPDQLKKAVVAFRKHPKDYFCFQAALNYYNEKENILTKLFTAEYSGWFDCILPGLFRTKLPIPLGGTSNHFDINKLRELGAWDPYNVTEDADLGIRASVTGYKVGVIDSTTYEEANSQIKNWIRQRSRWVKGFMITFLVHNRHPLQSIKSLGLRRWLAYSLLIGGTPATFLINPIMWGLFLCSLFATVNHFSIPPALFYISMINLIAGNGLAILIGMLGVLPRKKYHLLPYVLLTPFYWALQSVAAYKALWQLITKPYYWEKTEHGISTFSPSPQIEEANSA